VLVSAGGFGVGPVEALVREVCSVEHPVQVAVICGRNEELKGKIEAMGATRNPVKAVGYTTRMYDWMAASDILVGKAGGLTSSEALASGLVLAIVNPVPGQEERNSDYFLEKGVAIRCNDLPLLSYKLDGLLSDSSRFAAMRDKVKAIARPDAAADIVSHVLASRG
jgi:processive 1,2-diacylglycerol beta-glucosyltransferase